MKSMSEDMNARMDHAMSQGPGFFPGWGGDREAGLDDLDLSMVLSGTRLLERYRKPRSTPLNDGMSRPDPEGKGCVKI